MDPRAHQTRVEIFRAAAARTGDGRARYLDSACAGDAQLRQAVEHMLAAHDAATIAGPSAATELSPSFSPPAEQPAMPGLPARIGAYTIRGLIGEGGMGVVYLAEQDRPRRTVALKVVRSGLLTPRMMRRFELESQALARLSHPGIAAIYEASTADVGTHGGATPFFAMELVQGPPLTVFAGMHALGVRERMEMLARVCDAVHHAHQKGIIHRDLKPSNILVAGEGPEARPKILDFGVARATDADVQTVTLRTDAGELVGTLPYMSPEQVAGDPNAIDTRSDVYTLGVILYELLAGRLPHTVWEKPIPEAARIIAEVEPEPLSRADRTLRGDPETIVARAMEKDRARRYQSASELAEDIRRFLRSEPITARPAGRLYRARKFVRRNPGLVAGVAVAMLALAGGALGMAHWAARATEGWRVAEQRLQRAESAEAAAKAEAGAARAVSGFLNDMLRSIDPDNAGGREVTVREVVDEAAATITGSLDGRPRVESSIRATLAGTYQSLGRLDEALTQARAALAAAREDSGEDGDSAIDAERLLIGILADAGMFDEAMERSTALVQRVNAARGRGSGPSAQALGLHARVLLETGRQEEAVALFREALAASEAAFGPADRETMVVMNNLGTALKDRGLFDEAEALLRRLVTLRESAFGTDHPQTYYAVNALAAAVQKAGRNEDALDLLRRVLEGRRRILGESHVGTIVSGGNLGVALVGLGRVAEAEPLFRAALEGCERTLGPDHPKTLIMIGNLAYCLEDLGRLDDAEALYRRAIDSHTRLSGNAAAAERNPELWSAMNNLASLLRSKGDLAGAERVFAELVAMCKGTMPDHYYAAIFRNNYGDLLVDLRRFDEAERELTESLPVLERTFKAEHPRVARGRERLVRLYEQWGRPEQAARWK